MRTWKKYLITMLVGAAMVALILFSKDLFAKTEPVDIFHILCDAFFAVGVLITGAGLLVFSANEGTFDMLVYGVKTFVNMFRKNSEKKYDSFYDYRESRADSKLPFGFILICGLFYLAVGLLMYYFYCQY